MEEKTYCEKWPTGCQLCDLLLCDGKKEAALYKVTTMNKAGVPGEVLTFEYTHKCEPCKPTQPECGECEFAKPQTNGDSIRTMSDEELAEWERSMGACPADREMVCIDEQYAKGGSPFPPKEQCIKCWLDWLKQEAQPC